MAIVVIALLWWRENRRYDGPVQQVTAGAEQIARGRYLAQAADCAACHTASGGAPLAGGYPLETPFGTIYGSNLTPSADHGIGRWTKDDFFPGADAGRGTGRATPVPGDALHLVQGHVASGCRRHLRLPDDAPGGGCRHSGQRDAVPVQPAHGADRLEPAVPQPDPLPASSQGNSPQWQRGRYLADVLGHCGECHSAARRTGADGSR